ncbi:dihydroneopterin aldolase [Uliginosibacterium sp. 31-16]|uniref:dihydroneopterin aldolase n=1 Tax=Uliginosibacterium sp. 31-16 TaxID=3068315 RepID=UPI00273D060B|nr:dihydroneopterin aldolase [Uliginosibacterium sp. 31-16]MDP5239036.1 dihydroneopterin aldolase [Uliginosibacterium sp. 31-16]
MNAPNTSGQPALTAFINRRLRIRQLCLPASIGFHAAEKLHTQRVLIDIELSLAPLTHEIPDEIGASVDYDLLYQAIPELLADRHFNLLETLCHAILARCAALQGVVAAHVAVSKPDIYADCESAGYSAEWRI